MPSVKTNEMSQKRDKFPGFSACMRMMRQHDPRIQEDGFHFLMREAHRFVDELIVEFDSETDHGLRCWLLELLGDARDPKALPIFLKHLKGDDDSFRAWAVEGLKSLNTKEARRALYEAGIRR